MEQVMTVSSWSNDEAQDFKDVQEILLNLYPGKNIVEILRLNHEQRRASGIYPLFKRLKLLKWKIKKLEKTQS